MRRLFVCLLLMFPLMTLAQEEVVDTIAVDTVGYDDYYVPDYDNIAKAISDEGGTFYYPTLVRRFAAADTSLTFEQLHCLYYGFMFQPNFDPYLFHDNESKVMKILNKDNVSKRDAKKAIKLLDKIINEYPVHLRLYMLRYIANTVLYGPDSRQANDDAFRFVSLANVIASSGSGLDFEHAFHVVIVNHSYSLMSYYGFSPNTQSLSFEKGQAFDVFELDENEYGVESLYFNVDRCYKYLGSLFSDDEYSVDTVEVIDEKSVDNPYMTVLPLNYFYTVKVNESDESENLTLEIIDSKPFEGVVDITSDQSFFPDSADANTVYFIFANAKWGSGKDCIVLMMKSFYPEMLEYDTEILYEGMYKFTKTSNSGIFPKVIGKEIWNDKLQAIKISNLRRMK